VRLDRILRASGCLVATLVTLFARPDRAAADEPAAPDAPPPAAATPPTDPPPAPATPSSTSPASPASPEVVPAVDPKRAKSALPAPAEPTAPKPPFAVDPVADGALIGGAAAFAGILDLINSTGEVRPQQISPTFDRSQLLGIDRGAISQTPQPSAGVNSNIGLFVAIGFAVVDPVLTGVREKHMQSALVDAALYAESITITWALTNLAKIAVRRPRPRAYIEREAHKNDPTYSNADTDSSLSFFSGHSSMTATIAATATYLAFARAPHTLRPWLTLLLGTAVTAGVAIERVRYGAHFPTDVIAGAIAGAGVGVIVPHLHRTEDLQQRRVWVGFDAAARGGGTLTIGGVF